MAPCVSAQTDGGLEWTGTRSRKAGFSFLRASRLHTTPHPHTSTHTILGPSSPVHPTSNSLHISVPSWADLTGPKLLLALPGAPLPHRHCHPSHPKCRTAPPGLLALQSPQLLSCQLCLHASQRSSCQHVLVAEMRETETETWCRERRERLRGKQGQNLGKKGEGESQKPPGRESRR